MNDWVSRSGIESPTRVQGTQRDGEMSSRATNKQSRVRIVASLSDGRICRRCRHVSVSLYQAGSQSSGEKLHSLE